MQQFAAVCRPDEPEKNMAKVIEKLSGGKTPTRILCCGHSLGGALATLGTLTSLLPLTGLLALKHVLALLQTHCPEKAASHSLSHCISHHRNHAQQGCMSLGNTAAGSGRPSLQPGAEWPAL